MRTAASQHRPGSRTPTGSLSPAVGSALRRRRSSAGRGCRPSWRRRSMSSCVRANMAFAMYPGLAQGAIAALYAHGSAEQKALYLPKLIAGEWVGTMNLTEPQCGTDLGLVRTRATPQADRSYTINGTKIFISAGEHDLAENIVHLVLGRIVGAPNGTKGLSLFVVPKFLHPGGRHARRSQWRVVRFDRRKDGHPRQRHLRDELRWRNRLARGRRKSRAAGDVHDDERGQARRRRAGLGALRSRLSERRRLRQGAACRSRAHRRKVSR